MQELGVGVDQAAGVAERLEAGVGVLGGLAELVVGELLDDRAAGGVDYEPHGSELVADQPVALAALDHVVRSGAVGRVDEPGDQGAGGVVDASLAAATSDNPGHEQSAPLRPSVPQH